MKSGEASGVQGIRSKMVRRISRPAKLWRGQKTSYRGKVQVQARSKGERNGTSEAGCEAEDLLRGRSQNGYD